MAGKNGRPRAGAAEPETVAGSNSREHPITERQQPQMAVIPYGVITDRSIRPATFRVYAALLAYVERRNGRSNSGWAYPAQATLARDLGLAEGTIRRHIDHLVKLGLVEVHPRKKLHPQFRGHPRARAYRIADHPKHEAEQTRQQPREIAPPTARRVAVGIGATATDRAVEQRQTARRTDQ